MADDDSLEIGLLINRICDQFEAAWRQNRHPKIEEFLNRVPETIRVQLLDELIALQADLTDSCANDALTQEFIDSHSQQSVDATQVSSQVDHKDNSDFDHLVQIGNFFLREKIGEGGMGEIWLAEQNAPVKRSVALKLIKQGIGSKEIVGRFEAERQALALMNHPNIARILDAGTTSTGQPFFVMEYVEGKPLTAYCDDNKLSIDERLKLFMDVCAGVQHAHQKGIIHRDLKPGNVIVGMQDGQPVPKVIDFGLAKAMESTPRLTDQSLFTGIGQVLGTLKYMSPEQASLDNLDIDTRTDIYALGVILYELLTGSTPLDDSSIKGQAALKVLEYIREKEPVRPSSRLGSSTADKISTITDQRRTDSVYLKRILLGDLDWIVMKALEKDRTRRYESASGFAADIGRYLNSEPVVARPPSLNYRIQKFVRKNRIGVFAASLVVLTLLTGIGGTTFGLLRALAAERLSNERLQEATEARVEAENRRMEASRAQALAEAETAAKEAALMEETRQRQYAEAVTEFIENDFLALTSVEGQSRLFEDPTVSEMGKDTTLGDLLDRAAEKLRQRDNLAPEIEARLCSVVGNSYRANGDAEKGIPFLQRALKLCQKTHGPDSPNTLTSMNDLAEIYLAAGELDKALPLWVQAVEMMKVILGHDHPDTLGSINNLAVGYRDAGELEKGLGLLEESVEQHKVKFGPDHPNTLTAANNLAESYFFAGELDKALQLSEQTLELVRTKLGGNHPLTLTVMNNLAGCYAFFPERHGEAVLLYEQTSELLKTKLGLDHPQTLICLRNLALKYQAVGEPERALQLLTEIFELSRDKLGGEHPVTVTIMGSLAMVFQNADQFDKALPLMEQALDLSKSQHGPDHPKTLMAMNSLAVCYAAVRDLDRALPLYQQTLESSRVNLGIDHPLSIRCLENLALCNRDLGRLNESLSLHEELLELKKNKLGLDHPDTLNTMRNVAWTCRALGQLDKSIPIYEQLLVIREKKLGRQHPDTLQSLGDLGVNYKDAGRIEEAIVLLEESYQASRGMPGLEWIRGFLRAAYLSGGRAEEYRKLAEEDLAEARKNRGEDSNELATEIFVIAQGFQRLKIYLSAKELLQECLSIRRAKLGPDHPDSLVALRELAWTYHALGQYDKSIPVYEQLLVIREEKLGRQHADTLQTMGDLGVNYKDAGRIEDAIPLLEESFQASRGMPGLQWIRGFLRAAYQSGGRGEEFRKLAEEDLAEARKNLGEDSIELASELVATGQSFLRLKLDAAATELLREGVRIRNEKLPDDWRTFNARSILGAALFGQSQLKENDSERSQLLLEAETLLVEGYEGMKSRESAMPAAAIVFIPQALDRLIELYTALEQAEETDKYRDFRSAYPLNSPPTEKIK